MPYWQGDTFTNMAARANLMVSRSQRPDGAPSLDRPEDMHDPSARVWVFGLQLVQSHCSAFALETKQNEKSCFLHTETEA